jgi:hypothetical protein
MILKKAEVILFGILGLALLTVNLLLVRQNRRLAGLAEAHLRALEPQTGVRVPPIHGFDIGGREVSIGYGIDNRKTLVLVFATTCHVCDSNWPSWGTILRRLNRDSFRVVGVDLSSKLDQGYIVRHGIDGLPVLAEPDPRMVLAYNLNLTPQVILVSREGRIERVWTGALGRGTLADVEGVLGLR